MPRLVKLLDSLNYDDREAAAVALGKMGMAASSALPALNQAANDTRNPQRAGNTTMAQRAAREAIAKITGAASVN